MNVCDLVAKGLLSAEFSDIAVLGRVTPLWKGLKNKLRLTAGVRINMAQADHVDFVPHIQGRLSHPPWQ